MQEFRKHFPYLEMCMYLSLYTFMIGRCVPGRIRISKMMNGTAFIFNKNQNFLKLNNLFTGTTIRREMSDNIVTKMFKFFRTAHTHTTHTPTHTHTHTHTTHTHTPHTHTHHTSQSNICLTNSPQYCVKFNECLNSSFLLSNYFKINNDVLHCLQC